MCQEWQRAWAAGGPSFTAPRDLLAQCRELLAAAPAPASAQALPGPRRGDAADKRFDLVVSGGVCHLCVIVAQRLFFFGVGGGGSGGGLDQIHALQTPSPGPAATLGCP